MNSVHLWSIIYIILQIIKQYNETTKLKKKNFGPSLAPASHQSHTNGTDKFWKQSRFAYENHRALVRFQATFRNLYQHGIIKQYVLRKTLINVN